MRLFVAVDLPDEVREVIARGLGPLKRDLPAAHWVRPEGIHLTLKFLGEQPDETVVALRTRMPAVAATLAPVTVNLGGGGFFPTPRRPRVAWIGGAAPGMSGWATKVDDVAAELGVERESRAFSFHLTLARLDHPWGAQAVEAFTIRTGKWAFPEFTASEITLFRSELRPSGAVYTALERWAVGGTP